MTVAAGFDRIADLAAQLGSKNSTSRHDDRRLISRLWRPAH